MSSADTLFRDRNVFIIRETCPVTKKEITFKITKKDYEAAAESGFPATIESENYQGPSGLLKLQIQVNSALQVLKSGAVNVQAKKEESSLAVDYTSQVLQTLDLSDHEITTYFRMSGRGPIDAGEIMLLIDDTRDSAIEAANKLLDLGLARKIVGAADYWEALPPYAALVKQQEMFAQNVHNLKENTISTLDDRFKEFEQSTGGIKKLRDFQDFVLQTTSDLQEKLDGFTQKKGEITESSQQGISELRGFQDFIKNLGSELSKQIADQEEILNSNTQYFEQLKSTNDENIEGIKSVINDIRTKRDNVEQDLEDRFNKLAGTAQAQLTSQFQGLQSQFSTLSATLAKVNERVAQAVDAMRLGPNTIRIQAIVKKTLENSFSDIQNSLVNIQQAFIQNFHDNFNQIIKVNLSNFSSTIQGLLVDVVEQVEKIQQTNDGIVNSVKGTIDQVSANLTQNFQNTSNSFQNTINEAESKMGSVVGQLENLMQTIIDEFERVFSDVLTNFQVTANESKDRADALSGEIDTALTTIRDVFKSEVVKELEKILTGMEDDVNASQQTIMDFWERAKAEVMYSLKEVWFVRSPEAVTSAINEALPETKRNILIVAPTLDDIDMRQVLAAKPSASIRIACGIDITNERHLGILSVLDEKKNVAYRNYRGEVTIWGMNRDFEKCLVAIVSKSKEVAGIGTILSEDIKLFSPILEDCWMSAKKDVFEGGGKKKRIDKSKVDLSFKPTLKTRYVTPTTAGAGEATNKVIHTKSEASEASSEEEAEEVEAPKTVKRAAAKKPVKRAIAEEVEEAPAEVQDEVPEETSEEPELTATTMTAVSSAGVSRIFTTPPKDIKQFVRDGIKELQRLAKTQTGSSLGDNVEAFRQAIFNKTGFNSTLFELARAVRDLKAIPGPLNATQQTQFLERFSMWGSKLAA
jgi:uncharacterized protein YukE